MKQRNDEPSTRRAGDGARTSGARGARTPAARRADGGSRPAGAPQPVLRAVAAPHAGARRGRSLLAFLGLAVLALLVVLLVLPALGGGGPAAGGTPQRRVVFHVRLGDTVAAVADRLQASGVLGNGITAALFQADARLQGLGSHLRAGSYSLTTGMSPTAAVSALAQPPVPLQAPSVTVTIPEGWRLEQTAHLLASKGLVNEGEFLDLARHGQFGNDFLAGRPRGATLEGFLFPDTYNVPVGIGARGVIQMLLDQFGAQFALPLRRAAWARGRTIYDVVTMASLVEREAIFPAERPLIAGVYYNRLAGHEGGFFNADPTVQYAVGAATDASPEHTWWTRTLTRDDLAVDSPYNTYLYKGLPPGPICSPGLASLRAAAEPATTDYNYFYAAPGGGGHSTFCKTLACHIAATEGQ